jgi:hypothetical protein
MRARPCLFAAAAALVVAAILAARPFQAEAGLSSAEWKAVEEKASRAVQQGDGKGAAGAIREAAKDESPRAAKLVVQVVAKMIEDADVFEAGVEAVAALGAAETAVDELVKQAKSQKDARMRIWLVDALAARGAGATKRVAAFLDDKEDRVQIAAIRALATFATIEAVETIIGFAEKLESKGGGRGVVYQDALNALGRVLGTQLDGGLEYRSYLATHRGEFVNGKGIPKSEDRREAGGGRGGEAGGAKTVSLFGLEIRCKNVVLIIDVSGSMEVADPYPRGQGSTARGGGDGSSDPERKRINRAKKELSRVLDELAKQKAKVNVVAYSSDVNFWKPEGLHDLSAANLKSAKDFVAEFKADGVTVTDTALLMSFERVQQADCFYLITDGFATHDGETKVPTPQILAALADANRLRKVQINTLGFVTHGGAAGADPELLQAIASQAGGTYTEIE